MGHVAPPISDYATDTKSALDNSIRICQVGWVGGWVGGKGFGLLFGNGMAWLG